MHFDRNKDDKSCVTNAEFYFIIERNKQEPFFLFNRSLGYWYIIWFEMRDVFRLQMTKTKPDYLKNIFKEKGALTILGNKRETLSLWDVFRAKLLITREVHGLGQEILFRSVFPQRSKYFDMFKKDKMFKLFKIGVIQ